MNQTLKWLSFKIWSLVSVNKNGKVSFVLKKIVFRNELTKGQSYHVWSTFCITLSLAHAIRKSRLLLCRLSPMFLKEMN